MNAFYEHHQDSIRFGYRCFDRILLNGLIQPFQQPERVIGFFNTYRNQYPVSRDVLREIADQFQHWVKTRSLKWGAPIVDAPPGRRDEFVAPYFQRAQPDEVVVILRAREPARAGPTPPAPSPGPRVLPDEACEDRRPHLPRDLRGVGPDRGLARRHAGLSVLSHRPAGGAR
jgi:hypothetical protein